MGWGFFITLFAHPTFCKFINLFFPLVFKKSLFVAVFCNSDLPTRGFIVILLKMKLTPERADSVFSPFIQPKEISKRISSHSFMIRRKLELPLSPFHSRKRSNSGWVIITSGALAMDQVNLNNLLNKSWRFYLLSLATVKS